MTIATFGETPWPAIVYYLHDEDLNLYYVSHPEDIHTKNIMMNPYVACAIYDSSQPNSMEKKGIQLNGTVQVIGDISRINWMVKLWNKVIAGEEGVKFDPQKLNQMENSRVYRVKPKMIKFFNESLFPENNNRVLKLDKKL